MHLTRETRHLITQNPGVYKFLDDAGCILYVGKAKNLKKRVQSYFRSTGLNSKTLCMVQKIATIEVVCTETEHEALVLENALIKKWRPRYNISLKDDKTYPYIYLSRDPYPRIGVVRGKKGKNLDYFGPYTSAAKVYQVMDTIQKTFKIRTCRNNYFSNRSRACLLYQIGRCTAPCVEEIGLQEYAATVRQVRKFLQGKHQEVVAGLVGQMNQAAEGQQYEKAADIRDRIASIQAITGQEASNVGEEKVDIITSIESTTHSHIQVTCIRNQRILDSSTYSFENIAGSEEEVLEGFINQFYNQDFVRQDPPERILCLNAGQKKSVTLLECGRSIPITKEANTSREEKYIRLAMANTEAAITHAQIQKSVYEKGMADLAALFGEDGWERFECFDISHTQGHQTYASCVVFGNTGKVAQLYRLYKLDTGNDDCLSLQEAVSRRYREGVMTNMILVDGGKGQIKAVCRKLIELGLANIAVLAITKDPSRRGGLEHYTTWTPDGGHIEVDPSSEARRLLEQARDETHRFAIQAHRKARQKSSLSTTLTEIPGLGKQREKNLLSHLGGLKQLSQSTVEQIAQVPGISKDLAEKIWRKMRSENQGQ